MIWVHDSQQGLRIFVFATEFIQALVSTQPPIQWVLGDLSMGVKRPGREADHSSVSSAEVKNRWSHTSTHKYVLMMWCSVEKKHREFYFTFHDI
jgi:hypothetical protein